MANWFQSLTPQGRTIISIIVAAVSAVALFFITKWIVRAIEKARENKNPAEVVKGAEDDIKAEQAKGETLSHPSSAYTGAANTIEKLLDGCETFESEISAISNVVAVVNKPIDWFELVKVFGTREISDCGTFGASKTTYDLISLLKDQLDSTGVYKISQSGYNDSGFVFISITALRKFLKTKNVDI